MPRDAEEFAVKEEGCPNAVYGARIAAGELRPDSGQGRVVARLDRLYSELFDYPDISGHGSGLTIGRWRLAQFLQFGNKTKVQPRGVYLWGGVGRGKSMLMDMFYETAPVKTKTRRHFHEFMLDVHARLKVWRGYSPAERVAKGGRASEDDPIPPVAREIASEATLLCFDEMQVTDIADAMILARLFEALFDRGVIVVATSNRPPDDLYKNGLNRPLFLPFIQMLKDRLDVMSLNGDVDYRLDRLGDAALYLTPVNQETTDILAHTFFRLTDLDINNRSAVGGEELTVQGRKLTVPKAARGVAVFSFKRLCGEPKGAADYLAIARRYHTVIMVAVPKMDKSKRNEAKRFVTFIDALYEQRVKFLCNAEVAAEELYTDGSGAFEFERTVSRLMEMRSHDYLAMGHCSVD